MESDDRAGFTLVEVLIVVVILAVLAAVVVPQFTSRDDARMSTAQFNLNTLRSVIEAFRIQHHGALPQVDETSKLLEELLQKTAANGAIDANGEYGPYLVEFPENPFTGINSVTATAKSTITSGDVTVNNAGGWLFNEATGQIWLDSDPGFDM
jgi:prepilin-type N-terminal cleavage/methylation domain-containing protein